MLMGNFNRLFISSRENSPAKRKPYSCSPTKKASAPASINVKNIMNQIHGVASDSGLFELSLSPLFIYGHPAPTGKINV